MDIILVIVWILAMVLYSFSSDYAVSFPNHNNRALPFVRWGSLLIAMILSGYLAQAYQDNLKGNGIWVFIVVVFVVITLAKLVFKWVINRRR
ncbi:MULTISPECIES: hypothetical protein [unclassified Psychrobacter]|uniref:hypothetical protein n=1 Tax=unclassified Psychrobacter TaxID=196806 RepID=UPI00078BA44D|nr:MULTISPECIES: hypothetical protein [unclassified Psychrobacter]AMN49945.1 hypothetical protein AK823_08725 [Psychrobacter sp. P2G3]AMN67799.1 hypothetical protein AK825_08855 [Psychrobacter sp. P11G5]